MKGIQDMSAKELTKLLKRLEESREKLLKDCQDGKRINGILSFYSDYIAKVKVFRAERIGK